MSTEKHPIRSSAAQATRRVQLRKPPGPSGRWAGLPIMRAMAKDFLGYLQAQQRLHGDIICTRVVNERVYAVFSPDLVRAVIVDNAAHLIRQERPIEVFAQVQGQSVLVSEGEQWQRQHRMLRPGFAPRRVAGYGALMVEAARRSLEDIAPAQAGAGALVQVDEWMDLLTMDVILRTLFSSQADERTREVARAVKTLDECAMRELFFPMTLPDWLPLPGKAGKRWALKVLNRQIDDQLEARRRALPGTAPAQDLLAMLLDARDEEGAQGTGNAAGALPQGLSDDEIRDQCRVIFLAGFETSSTALQWWTALMASHPEAAYRARDEIDRVIGQRDPRAEDMAQLPWLTATLKETMRLYPPAPALITRRTTADIQVGEWLIPKRALVTVLPWAAQHDARWFPDPEAFRPERFMPDAAPIPRGAWVPFGTGPRVCMGQHFAMLEMTMVAAMILQRYQLAQAPGQASVPDAVLQITLRPRGGLQVVFTRR